MKILIAEDDKFLANAYRLKLERLGHQVTIAVDGNDTLVEIEKNIPEIIILDLIMPNKDGFSTLEEIKVNPNYKNIPVLVASNLGQDEDIKRAKDLGAVDYVIKSNISLDDLVKKLEQHVATAKPKTI